MADYTTHLNLVKPIGSEAFDVGHANGNMDLIDTAFNKIKLFDQVIKTQAEFETLIASPTWLGAVSVCFIGDGGTLKFTRSDGTGIKIPSTVKQIQGFNSAIIEVTNFAYNSTTNKAALWYATLPNTKEYYISDLTVNCIINPNTWVYGYAFHSCYQLINCTGSVNDGGAISGGGQIVAFLSCNILVNCTGIAANYANATGFSSCGQLINCTGIGTANHASQGVGVGFSFCTQMSNCTGTGNGHNGEDGAFGFRECNQITNSTGTGNGNGGYAAGFSRCVQVVNCIGTGVGTGFGCGFEYCDYLTGFKASATPSSYALLGFGNTFVGATLDEVLPLNNIASFTPTADYHPTTKKYVDDKLLEVNSKVTVDEIQPVMQEYIGAITSAIGSITSASHTQGTETLIDVDVFSPASVPKPSGKIGFTFGDKLRIHNTDVGGVDSYIDAEIISEPFMEVYRLKVAASVVTQTISATQYQYIEDGFPIDWNTSDKYSVLLTKDTFVNFIAPTNAKVLNLRVIQDGIGGHNLYIPSNWAYNKTITTFSRIDSNCLEVDQTANSIHNIRLYYDKTLYHNMNLVNIPVNIDEVLTLKNIASFIPTADYHPSTKKYVDDKVPLDPPIVNVTASKTLILSNTHTFQLCNSASQIDITVPLNSSVAFVTRTEIVFFREGAGKVRFVPAGGVTILSSESKLFIDKQNEAVTLKKVGTDKWVLVGALALE